MNILVLGGNGYIGRNLLRELIKVSHNVVVFDKKCERKYDNVKYVEGDFTRIKEYPEIFENIDAVYHLISSSVPNSNRSAIADDIRINLISTVDMLNTCVDKKVKKVIFSSSGGTIYGSSIRKNKETDLPMPQTAYSINKYAIERYLEYFYVFCGLDYTVLRITNPFGGYGGGGVLNTLLASHKNNCEVEIWGDGSVKRDYIYIEDVISALILVLGKYENKVFNICSGRALSINELSLIIEKTTGRKPKLKYTPSRVFDLPVNYCDNTLALNEMHWKPEYTVEQGICKVLGGNI